MISSVGRGSDILSLAFYKKLSILGRVFSSTENREEVGAKLGNNNKFRNSYKC